MSAGFAIFHTAEEYVIGPFQTRESAQGYIDTDHEPDQLVIYELARPVNWREEGKAMLTVVR